MKKLFFISLLSVIFFGFVSCKKDSERYPNGYPWSQYAPTVSCTLGSPLGTTTIGDNYVVTITASHAERKIVKVGWNIDTLKYFVNVNSRRVTQSFTISGLTTGIHQVGIYAIDQDGNRGTQAYYVNKISMSKIK